MLKRSKCGNIRAEKQLLDLLSKHKRPLTLSEIAKKLSCSPGRFSVVLKKFEGEEIFSVYARSRVEKRFIGLSSKDDGYWENFENWLRNEGYLVTQDSHGKTGGNGMGKRLKKCEEDREALQERVNYLVDELKKEREDRRKT